MHQTEQMFVKHCLFSTDASTLYWMVILDTQIPHLHQEIQDTIKCQLYCTVANCIPLA